MAFDKQEKDELRSLLEGHRSHIASDTRSIIREELEEIKQRIADLLQMESEDVGTAYEEIESLKKRVTKLERKLASAG